MWTAEEFKRFVHPNAECKCCHPHLWVKHPSTQCACCIVAWEASGKEIPFQQWIQNKLEQPSGIKAKALPPTVKKTLGQINIIIDTGFVQVNDTALFGEEEIHKLPANTSFADLMVKFLIFPSKGQAKKNGWDRPIPVGWSEWIVGKLKHHFFIWSPSE